MGHSKELWPPCVAVVYYTVGPSARIVMCLFRLNCIAHNISQHVAAGTVGVWCACMRGGGGVIPLLAV